MFSPQNDSSNGQNNGEIRTRARSMGCGCLGILVTIVIVVATVGGIGIGVLAVVSPNTLDKLMSFITGQPAPESQAVPGNASSFDPFAAYPGVQAFAGADAQLLEITADYVRSDGTMDLTATYKPAPNVEYKFVHVVPRPANAPPVGAGGTTSGPWYEPISINAYQPGQRRTVTTLKNGIRTTFQYVNDGMTREVDDPTTTLSSSIIPEPKCSPADLWKIALTQDAPRDAVAIITYNAEGYSFEISGALVNLDFDQNCALKTP